MARNGNGVFTIDGMTLRLWVTSLKRSFQVLDTENSGRLQSYLMHRDIAGTFYNYTLEIDPDKSNRADYDQFYEIVSAPVESHSMVFPYGQETLEFEAYVTNGEDELRMEETEDGHINKWSGLSLNFVAMEPYRRP
uniref:Uncharacterized protein n=1 Tax=Dulem virus 35 TaxID=3145753 RepID=A0AAU8B0M2_9CAUD